jgi:hypothetical protein
MLNDEISHSFKISFTMYQDIWTPYIITIDQNNYYDNKYCLKLSKIDNENGYKITDLEIYYFKNIEITLLKFYELYLKYKKELTNEENTYV